MEMAFGVRLNLLRWLVEHVSGLYGACTAEREH